MLISATTLNASLISHIETSSFVIPAISNAYRYMVRIEYSVAVINTVILLYT